MATTPPCTRSVIGRSVNLFALATMITLIYIGISIPAVECFFEARIPDPVYRLLTKALLFFVLVYIVDRISVGLRRDITADICEF